MEIVSWNVAGLRALLKKDGLGFTLNTDIDIICMQETKALESQVTIPIGIFL
jgi:exodeoxyribonuclease-3